MKKFSIILFVLFSVSLFNSCNKNEIIKEQEVTSSKYEIADHYKNLGVTKEYFDKGIKEFARFLALAMNNRIIRKYIKTEALKQFDGDYDILWKNFKNKSINVLGKEIKFLKLIDNNQNYASTKLEEFNLYFGNLQISVPVNCEKWNTDNFTPVVVYLDTDYNDKSEIVNGFDNKGNPIELNAKIEPSFPVVVVSLNERTDINGNMISEDNSQHRIGEGDCPLMDPVLSGSTSGNQIYLSWNITGPDCIEYYEIYRKGPSDADFIKIGTNYGYNNKVYYDFAGIIPGRIYSYYVVAKGSTMPPATSNIVGVEAPPSIEPISYFEALTNTNSEIELRWSNDNKQFDYSRLLYHIPGLTTDYSPLATFDVNTAHYFDHPNAGNRGKKIQYMFERHDGTQISDPKYDFIILPYRNPIDPSPIYVSNISFTTFALENWPAGKPEFKLTVANYDPTKNNGNEGSIIQENVIFKFSSRSKSQDFSNRFLFDWRPMLYGWYDKLSFKLVEYDVSIFNMTVELYAKYTPKNLDKTGFDSEISAKISINIHDMGEDCGNAYTSYYDTPNFVLRFPNYGATVTIKDTPN